MWLGTIVSTVITFAHLGYSLVTESRKWSLTHSFIDEDLLSCQDLAEPVAELSQPTVEPAVAEPLPAEPVVTPEPMIATQDELADDKPRDVPVLVTPQCVTRRETGNAAATTSKEVSTLARGSVKKKTSLLAVHCPALTN